VAARASGSAAGRSVQSLDRMSAAIPPFTSVDNLVAAVRGRVFAPSHLVAVDGFMNAGKTTLAFKLAEMLGGIRLSFDTFADRDVASDDYAAKIRLNYLASDLRKLHATFPFVVADGICMLQVLEAVSAAPDTLVYVKRISSTDIWHDGFHLEDYEGQQTVEENRPGLDRSQFEYHAKWRPHERAHFIYVRKDQETS